MSLHRLFQLLFRSMVYPLQTLARKLVLGAVLEGADVILDATDNFETRYLINDFAVREGVPWIYGAAVGSYRLAMPVLPGDTACFRCLYPEPPAGAQPGKEHGSRLRLDRRSRELRRVVDTRTGSAIAW